VQQHGGRRITGASGSGHRRDAVRGGQRREARDQFEKRQRHTVQRRRYPSGYRNVEERWISGASASRARLEGRNAAASLRTYRAPPDVRLRAPRRSVLSGQAEAARAPPRLARLAERGWAAVLGAYARSLDWVLANKGLVLAILAAALVALLSQRHHFARIGTRRYDAAADIRGALRQPVPWLLTLIFAAYALQFFAVVIWLPTFLKEQRLLSAGTIALLTALVIAVNVPGNLVGGTLLHRHVNRGRLIASASLAMGLAGLGIFSEALPDPLRYLCCLLLTGAGGLIPVAVLSSSAVLAERPQQIGTLQGLYLQGSNLGQFAGIPLVAAIVAANGGRWQSALIVTASASAICVVLGLLVARAGK